MMETILKMKSNKIQEKIEALKLVAGKAIIIFVDGYNESCKFNFPLYNTIWFNHPYGMR